MIPITISTPDNDHHVTMTKQSLVGPTTITSTNAASLFPCSLGNYHDPLLCLYLLYVMDILIDISSTLPLRLYTTTPFFPLLSLKSTYPIMYPPIELLSNFLTNLPTHQPPTLLLPTINLCLPYQVHPR